MMTREQALNIPELCIDVDAATEDAFFFLSYAEDQKTVEEMLAMNEEEEREYDLYCDASQHAGDRLTKVPREERMEAIRKAYQMIENKKTYGVPCAEWCEQ